MRNIDKKQIRGDIARRKAMPDFGISPDTNISRLKTIQETQRSFNLEVVETLLDELEASQKYAKDRDAENEDLMLTVGRLRVEREAAEKRIAEPEAREIKPASGEVLVTVAGFTGCGKSAIAGEIEIAMKAIGVPVQWANGDAEKRMTGADWLTAIELYKPSVRIVEVNVPRAAADGKGAAK